MIGAGMISLSQGGISITQYLSWNAFLVLNVGGTSQSSQTNLTCVNKSTKPKLLGVAVSMIR